MATLQNSQLQPTSNQITLKPAKASRLNSSQHASPAPLSTNYSTHVNGFNSGGGDNMRSLKFNSQYYNPVSERGVTISGGGGIGQGSQNQSQHNRMLSSSFTIDGQKYRDSSIYNRNFSIQVMKEEAFKRREMELRKKYEGIDLDKLKELLPNISNRSTYSIEDVYTKPLSPSALNKQSYLEIFNSKKESMRKHLNYANYTNTNYNVISNNTIGNEGDAYQNYLTKRMDYDSQVPQYRDAQDASYGYPQYNTVIAQKILDPSKFDLISQDRKQMRLKMKSHILRNIRKAKEGRSSSQASSLSMIQNTIYNNQTSYGTGFNTAFNANSFHSSNEQIAGVKGSEANKTSVGFNAKNFYKYLEMSKPQQILVKDPVVGKDYQKFETNSLLLHKIAKVQSNDATPHSQTLALNTKRQALNQEDVYGQGASPSKQAQDDLISVIGRQNNIKQNAYSDVNVEDLMEIQRHNQQQMKKLAERRKLMNSQQSGLSGQSKYRLNTKNLSQLSRQHKLELNSSRSAKNLSNKKTSMVEGPQSEYSNANSVAFSKRWQNLENYIQAKKSSKLKQQAYSHAQSIAADSETNFDAVSRSNLSSRVGDKTKEGANTLRYRSQSVVDATEKDVNTSKIIREILKNPQKTRDTRKAMISGIEEEEESQSEMQRDYPDDDSSSELSLRDLEPLQDEDDYDFHPQPSAADYNEKQNQTYAYATQLQASQLQGQNSSRRQLDKLAEGKEKSGKKVQRLKDQLKEERLKRKELEKLVSKYRDSGTVAGGVSKR